jgi:hypothetical protein
MCSQVDLWHKLPQLGSSDEYLSSHLAALPSERWISHLSKNRAVQAHPLSRPTALSSETAFHSLV